MYLADIGGTNARFALMDRGEIGPVEHLKVADFSSATDAIAAFLRSSRGRGDRPRPRSWASQDRCRITVASSPTADG